MSASFRVQVRCPKRVGARCLGLSRVSWGGAIACKGRLWGGLLCCSCTLPAYFVRVQLGPPRRGGGAMDVARLARMKARSDVELAQIVSHDTPTAMCDLVGAMPRATVRRHSLRGGVQPVRAVVPGRLAGLGVCRRPGRSSQNAHPVCDERSIGIPTPGDAHGGGSDSQRRAVGCSWASFAEENRCARDSGLSEGACE